MPAAQVLELEFPFKITEIKGRSTTTQARHFKSARRLWLETSSRTNERVRKNGRILQERASPEENQNAKYLFARSLNFYY